MSKQLFRFALVLVTLVLTVGRLFAQTPTVDATPQQSEVEQLRKELKQMKARVDRLTKLVESVEDILEELGPMVKPVLTATGSTVSSPAELQLNEIERAILDLITVEALPIDRVHVQLSLGFAAFITKCRGHALDCKRGFQHQPCRMLQYVLQLRRISAPSRVGTIQ